MIVDIVDRLSAFFANNADVDAVYLFGSQAKGRAAKGSDVDVAILFDPNHIPPPRDVLELQDTVASSLGVSKADVVVLNLANPILCHQVYRYGQCVLDRTPRHTRAFMVRSQTEYADLKRVRAPIEAALLKGRIHGR